MDYKSQENIKYGVFMAAIETVASLFTALKAIKELASSLIEIRDSTIVESKIIELNSMVLDAQDFALSSQSVQHRLSEEISALKKEIMQAKNWAAEKRRYNLKNIKGVFVYELKKELVDAGEQYHQICANCYENQYKSLLQHEASDKGMMHKCSYMLVCHKCA